MDFQSFSIPPWLPEWSAISLEQIRVQCSYEADIVVHHNWNDWRYIPHATADTTAIIQTEDGLEVEGVRDTKPGSNPRRILDIIAVVPHLVRPVFEKSGHVVGDMDPWTYDCRIAKGGRD